VKPCYHQEMPDTSSACFNASFSEKLMGGACIGAKLLSGFLLSVPTCPTGLVGLKELLVFLICASLTNHAASPLLPSGRGGLAVLAGKIFHDEWVSTHVTE
jgi:hypothetical protein